MTAAEFRALQRQPDWNGKEPPAIREQDGTWVFTTRPKSEQDVIDACLHIASWYGWQPLKDAKGAMLWYRTSETRKSRLSPGTPDYHFVDIKGRVRPIEFKGPDTKVTDRQRFLADKGISTIIGPDDLMKFKETIGGK